MLYRAGESGGICFFERVSREWILCQERRSHFAKASRDAVESCARGEDRTLGRSVMNAVLYH